MRILVRRNLCGVLALSLIAACSMESTSPQNRSTDSKGTWSAKTPMPIQIGEVTVAAANNKIYVIGGSTADRVDQQLNQEYDIATNSVAQSRAAAARPYPCSGDIVERENLCCRRLYSVGAR